VVPEVFKELVLFDPWKMKALHFFFNSGATHLTESSIPEDLNLSSNAARISDVALLCVFNILKIIFQNSGFIITLQVFQLPLCFIWAELLPCCQC
jgi:hypothetical protein